MFWVADRRSFFLDSRDCLVLKVLKEEQNITKAAKRLYISQPTLTYRLNRLETEFNAKLLIRHAGGVYFTDAGKYVADFACKLLIDMDELKARIQTMNARVEGTVCVGISTVFSKYKLAHMLKQFQKKFPLIKVVLKTGSSTFLLPAILEKGEADLIIRRGRLEWSGVQHVLMEEPFGIISSKEIVLDKLSTRTLIFTQVSKIMQSDVMFYQWAKSHNIDLQNLNSIEVDSIEGCLQLVLQDIGWTVLPKIHITNHKNLFFHPLLSPEGNPITRETILAYPSDTPSSVAVEKFISFITTECFPESVQL